MLTEGIYTVNAAPIADIVYNGAIENIELNYLASAGDTVDIDVTDKQSIFAFADKACQYSIDGGSYIDFNLDSKKRLFLNLELGTTKVTIKSTEDATTTASIKA